MTRDTSMAFSERSNCDAGSRSCQRRRGAKAPTEITRPTETACGANRSSRDIARHRWSEAVTKTRRSAVTARQIGQSSTHRSVRSLKVHEDVRATRISTWPKEVRVRARAEMCAPSVDKSISGRCIEEPTVGDDNAGVRSMSLFTQHAKASASRRRASPVASRGWRTEPGANPIGELRSLLDETHDRVGDSAPKCSRVAGLEAVGASRCCIGGCHDRELKFGLPCGRRTRR